MSDGTGPAPERLREVFGVAHPRQGAFLRDVAVAGPERYPLP